MLVIKIRAELRSVTQELKRAPELIQLEKRGGMERERETERSRRAL
jgi:hypothetical protein